MTSSSANVMEMINKLCDPEAAAASINCGDLVYFVINSTIACLTGNVI